MKEKRLELSVCCFMFYYFFWVCILFARQFCLAFLQIFLLLLTILSSYFTAVIFLRDFRVSSWDDCVPSLVLAVQILFVVSTDASLEWLISSNCRFISNESQLTGVCLGYTILSTQSKQFYICLDWVDFVISWSVTMQTSAYDHLRQAHRTNLYSIANHRLASYDFVPF